MFIVWNGVTAKARGGGAGLFSAGSKSPSGYGGVGLRRGL